MKRPVQQTSEEREAAAARAQDSLRPPRLRLTKRGVAVVLTLALSAGVGAVAGAEAIDNNTKHVVGSVTETMPQGGDYISLAKKAVIDLGLNPDDYSATRIGQEVKGDSTPQPGQQVKFDEVQHLIGMSVEGTNLDANN
ncbi:hypothetical protein EPN95_02950 [Patescibacteria group bacterium]|nr:MAG: hypothetical protein EPN95_02950 [Patescibacteria group bacterium]